MSDAGPVRRDRVEPSAQHAETGDVWRARKVRPRRAAIRRHRNPMATRGPRPLYSACPHAPPWRAQHTVVTPRSPRPVSCRA
ncbi:hypothetical protein LC55x_5655 [Lysobacter capsici]|nr:hypothetical protein LC55x_5655 [Lysobacter capsici]